MLSTILYYTTGLVIFFMLFKFIFDNLDSKEGLVTKKEKEENKQKAEQQKKVEAARAGATPAQINANNIKYLQKTFDRIDKDIEDVKKLFKDTIGNIKEECCKLNNFNKQLACEKPGGKNLPNCTNQNPCKPCKNTKDPFSCCKEVQLTY